MGLLSTGGRGCRGSDRVAARTQTGPTPASGPARCVAMAQRRLLLLDDGGARAADLVQHGLDVVGLGAVLLEGSLEVSGGRVELGPGDAHALVRLRHRPAGVLQRPARLHADELNQELL